MNKRGLSDVLTTLLIVLLSIVAIGVVWVIIQNLISEGEEISLVGLSLNLKIEKATANESNLNVNVKRNAGEGELVAINFIISDGSNSDVLRKNTNLKELGSENFAFYLSVLDVGEIAEISIAPVYLSPSGKEIVGGIIDTITFGSGEVGSGGGIGAGSGDSDNNGIPDNEESSGEGSETTCGNSICESGETSTSCPADCGSVAECVPVCSEFECGSDGCGGTCGTCEEGFTCGQDQLCYDTSCTPDPDPCATAGAQCGTANDGCGTEVECGNCPLGFDCLLNQCIEAVPIETGTILNVWPPGIGIYFDSNDLAKVDNLYYGYSVAFPQVDTTNCYVIVGHNYDPSVYNNSIIEINILEPLSLNPGNTYSVWASSENCIASLQ